MPTDVPLVIKLQVARYTQSNFKELLDSVTIQTLETLGFFCV